ncbi:hypothetical protein SFC79_09755 [Nocardioides sp. S-58]|uniref:Flippase-like domain-containing protein n=1 Tax=Nocardioides renjunii TaxID=3095075 RepID=A0ABU5KBU1_9ACTN|nr:MULTISPECIES: hypothetical protein [unclassified Nocardioides]MDZ5662045.1 hypothetical protein [Nocardioides sp. S-58]WQQ24284.1 hypothetical protein SHK17_09905 [Nocardioides sp. S-34]
MADGVDDDVDDVNPEADRPAAPRAHPARRLGVLALCVVVVWLALRFVGDVDWSAVRSSLGKLSWPELAALVGLLLVRNGLNALPLALFIPGLGMLRALVNDLTAHLLAVVAPPPSDILVRLRMFASWDVPAPVALAGAVANTIVFYTVRFAMPLVGAALLVATRWQTGPVARVLLSTLVAGTILAVALAAVRRESTAARVGLTAGRAVRRVRSATDPEQWSESAVTFRTHVAAGFRSHLAVSVLGLVAMVLVDATIVVLTLRFVGVGAGAVPALDVYVAFCLVYPFTLFPLMGLGIVDGLLVAEMVAVGGDGVEAAAIAGLVVWRTVTLGGPIVLGALTLAAWRLGLVPPRRTPTSAPGRHRDDVAPS